MVRNSEADYLAATDDPATRILYVDHDDVTVAALTEYVEREDAAVELAGTTDAAAGVDVVRSENPDCLVVGGGLSEADRRVLVSAADCPVVAFTTAGPDAASGAVVAAADAVLEKGTDERILGMLVEKARQLAQGDADDGVDSVARALAHVGDDSKIDSFLVEDGEAVWSSRPFEAVFPTASAGGSSDDFDERLATVFGTAPDGADELLTTVAGPGNGDASRDASFGATRYYRHARHSLEGVSAERRLDVFEDVTGRVEREASSWMHELLVDEARDGLYVIDAEGVLVFANDAFASMLGYEPDELVGKHAAEIFAEGELHAAQRDVQNVVESDETGGEGHRAFVSSDGEEVPVSVNYTVLAGDERPFDGFVCVARDVTERRKRETELAAHRDELARINRADELLKDVVRELGQVATREELERVVCQCLLDVDGVTMAWMGQREGANDRIVPGTVVGDPQQYLRDVGAKTSVADAEDGPVLRAVQSGEVQIANDFREDEMVAQWRELALSYDVYSLAMIPLIHGETVHGVLAVYGDRPGAFTDAMAERFTLLGDTIGFAITAIQNKRLIEQDVTMELEFRSESDGATLVRLARACGCRLETVGSVDLGDDVLQYLSVDGAPVDVVVEAALASEDISSARVVRAEGADAGVVELRTPASLQTALSDAGARLLEGVATTDGIRIVTEAPSDGDVRTILEAVRRTTPDAELLTKTDGSRTEATDGTPVTAGAAVGGALTDRQREVLQAAYLAGYYAWPRDTTAEELAESLDIASPTLHQHLRRAEHNILAALFD